MPLKDKLEKMLDSVRRAAEPEIPAAIDWKKIDAMGFPERIRTLIRLAKAADPEYMVHGAQMHKYQLNPPAALQDIRAFEQEYHVTLPESFVRFLTEVGNGGAGVDYGIYSLDKMRQENEHLKNIGEGKVILDYDNAQEKWTELVTECEALEHMHADTPEQEAEIQQKDNAIYADMLRGLLSIGTEGCTYDNILICSGKHTGKMGMIDWNLEEYSTPFAWEADFEEWMCTHFKKIIQGDVTKYKTFWIVNTAQKKEEET